ncbi:hypothetical protein IFM89_036779 [Coptis chinensis]|uniref:mRNA (guanine-N(7))-methyltransferase n=1 Tax=Coptis chinensis TaxID=261450 RepID=A0A835LXX2_9MAGN|nr:hypothetical protein IFM89_036779 [Coptis chinensis]
MKRGHVDKFGAGPPSSSVLQVKACLWEVQYPLPFLQGGDLIKWDKAKVGYYVGIDISEGSIEDCRTRYNGGAIQNQRCKNFTFPARLLCGDCFQVGMDKALEDDAPFDICSC